jgi:hypothetical protein
MFAKIIPGVYQMFAKIIPGEIYFPVLENLRQLG